MMVIERKYMIEKVEKQKDKEVKSDKKKKGEVVIKKIKIIRKGKENIEEKGGNVINYKDIEKMKNEKV